MIPLAAGDATDTSARAIIEELSRELKVAIVPVNRPGAAGALGTDLVVKAPKDGHTILLTNNAALVFRTVLDPKTATYDPFRDLTPLALAMRSPSILVANAEQPYRNFKEMIEYAKKAPLSIGTAGVGLGGPLLHQHHRRAHQHRAHHGALHRGNPGGHRGARQPRRARWSSRWGR